MGKSGVGKSAGTSGTKLNSNQETADNANERPEWLPDGWNIEVRTRKSGPAVGTAYKCYVDPLNIHKFYSKPEVLRHLETTKDSNCSSKKKKGTSKHSPSKEEEKCIDKHSPNKEKQKRTNSNQHSSSKEEEKCINMHSTSKGEEKLTSMHSPKNTAEKANERPEWLPDGWDVIVQTRKSGPAMGSAYKCYIDPLNIHKFYSKPEVLRHLETTKSSNCSSKKKKGTSKHSPSKEEEEKCTNKHSPNKEEEKCIDKHSPNKEKQKRTNSNQHPPSKEEEKIINTHSPSKGEEEYIKMDSGSKDGEKTSMHSSNNVAGEKSAEEDLPPGWIKEVKIRKNRNGNRKDWLYIDPVSGYVFHSKKDVQRYLESGDIDKCAIKPSRRQYQDDDNLTPSPAAKRQKPKQSTPRQKISVAKEPAESLELPDFNNSMKRPDVSVPSGMMVAPDTSGESLKVSHRSSRRLAGAEPVKLADNVSNNQTPIVPKRNLRKTRTTLADGTENKSSQHLNGVPETEQLKAMNMRTTLSEDNKPESRTRSNKISKKKEPHIPCRASKRLAGSESKRSKEVTAELQQGEGGLDHAPLNGESQNKRRNSPLVLPAADNQLETLEVDDEKSEPQLSFAFHYSWSDPCLDYAINTLTSVLPLVDNSIDNGPSTVPETDIQKPTFDTVMGSRDSQNNSVDNGPTTVHETDLQNQNNSADNGPAIVHETDIQNQNNSADNGPATVHETDIQNQNNSVDNGPTTVHETDIQKSLIDNVTGRSKDSQSNLLDNVTRGRDKKAPVQSNKSKRKKEAIVPMRLSKRLAGIEPEAKPSDKALEYSSKKSSKEEPTATVLLTNGASDHLHVGEEAKLTRNASDSLKTEMLGKSSRKNGKLSDDQTVHKEQKLEKAEAENISDDRSKPELTLPFGESWSDPCLEFAFKTLTGALPVDSPAEMFKVPSPGVGEPPNNELHGTVTTSINGKTHDNANPSLTKKEHNMADQSSKPLLGQPELMTSSTSGKDMDGESSELPLRQPELRTSSTSGKNVPKFTNGESRSHEVLNSTSTTGESHSYESEMIRNLFEEPLFVEAENTTQLLDHSRTNAYTQIQEEPLKNDQVAEGEIGTSEQTPPFQTETLDHNNTELQFCESFMNTWSDPCLEFAFKTLTGVIPVEENLGVQGGIEEPSNCHNGRDDVALPDFGSSSFSQNDFSFHFDTGVKSTPGQQSSVSSSFPSRSLHSCPGVDPQQQYSQFNDNFQGR